MIGTFTLFTQTQHKPYQTKISLPNGQTSSITSCGNVTLSPTLTLLNVLYVPIFQHNLLSIPKLTKDTGCQIMFTSDSCFLIPKHSTTLVPSNGLYYFHPTPSLSTTLHILDTIPPTPPLSLHHLWNCRLGHVPHARLSHIPQLPPLPFPKDICLTRPIAKFTKLSYPLSQCRTSDLFHLIHTDIWGPYKTPSRGNHKHFLTIVDDHSRITWVSLLKLKSDAFSILKAFVLMAHTQYGQLVKVIRSDNALEFANSHCNNFFSQQGIRHQTSCVDRPQQN